jgi:hypothetical protein
MNGYRMGPVIACFSLWKCSPTGWLAAIVKALLVTRAVALLRYGMTAPGGADLHAIWGLASTGEMRPLGLAVLVAYAIALTWLAMRVVTRTALRHGHIWQQRSAQ